MIWVKAKDADEAYDKLFTEEYDVLVLKEFLEQKVPFITITYGECKSYVYNNSEDEDCEDLGTFELSWEEFVMTYGINEFMFLLKEYCKG